MKSYPVGTRVQFKDCGNVIHGASDWTVCEGVVNGPQWPDLPGWVKVYAKRDSGREATTILVAVENIVGVVE